MRPSRTGSFSEILDVAEAPQVPPSIGVIPITRNSGTRGERPTARSCRRKKGWEDCSVTGSEVVWLGSKTLESE